VDRGWVKCGILEALTLSTSTSENYNSNSTPKAYIASVARSPRKRGLLYRFGLDGGYHIPSQFKRRYLCG
jgi:hypothetical protein